MSANVSSVLRARLTPCLLATSLVMLTALGCGDSTGNPGLDAASSDGPTGNVSDGPVESAGDGGSGDLGAPGRGDGGSECPTPRAAPQEDPAAPARLAMVLRGPPTAASTDAAIEALARAGIEVFSDDGGCIVQIAAPPVSGLRVLQFQARGMAMEIARADGRSGSELNQLVGALPLPDGGALPFSAFLAAYVTQSESFGGALAGALVGQVDQADHEKLVYSSLTFAMFVREVLVPMLADARADGMPMSVSPAVRSPLVSAAADPCGAISDFLDDLPGAVERAIPRASGLWGTLLAVTAKIAGAATYVATEAARQLIRNNPFVAAIRRAASALGVLGDLRAIFSQWKLDITAAPSPIHKTAEGSTPNAGRYTLRMSGGGDSLEWPQAVESCADLFGIELPDLGSADGSTVTWGEVTGFPALAIKKMDTKMIAGGISTYDFATALEPREIHDGGGTVVGAPAVVEAVVGLPGLERLGSHIAGVLDAPEVGGVVGAGGEAAAKVLGPKGTGTAQVQYHSNPPAVLHVVVEGGGGGTMTLHTRSCSGLLGRFTGTATLSGSANGSTNVQWQFDPVTKTAPLAFHIFGVGADFTVDYDVTATITLAGSAQSPAANINGSASGVAHVPGFGDGPFGPAPFVGEYPIALGATSECP